VWTVSNVRLKLTKNTVEHKIEAFVIEIVDEKSDKPG
jgi:hypothetical protein